MRLLHFLLAGFRCSSHAVDWVPRAGMWIETILSQTEACLSQRKSFQSWKMSNLSLFLQVLHSMSFLVRVRLRYRKHHNTLNMDCFMLTVIRLYKKNLQVKCRRSLNNRELWGTGTAECPKKGHIPQTGLDTRGNWTVITVPHYRVSWNISSCHTDIAHEEGQEGYNYRERDVSPEIFCPQVLLVSGHWALFEMRHKANLFL